MQVYAVENNKTGNWEVCKKSHNTCCTMTPDTAAKYNAGKNKTMRAAYEFLGKGAVFFKTSDYLVLHSYTFTHCTRTLKRCTHALTHCTRTLKHCTHALTHCAHYIRINSLYTHHLTQVHPGKTPHAMNETIKKQLALTMYAHVGGDQVGRRRGGGGRVPVTFCNWNPSSHRGLITTPAIPTLHSLYSLYYTPQKTGHDPSNTHTALTILPILRTTEDWS
jgi:hypothetical protein